MAFSSQTLGVLRCETLEYFSHRPHLERKVRSSAISGGTAADRRISRTAGSGTQSTARPHLLSRRRRPADQYRDQCQCGPIWKRPGSWTRWLRCWRSARSWRRPGCNSIGSPITSHCGLSERWQIRPRRNRLQQVVAVHPLQLLDDIPDFLRPGSVRDEKRVRRIDDYQVFYAD